MRGLVEGLGTPMPIGRMLPALLQGDDLAQRLAAAFDDGLAPVISALDNLECYFNPALAPDDFVEWVAGWVGVAVDENWPTERRREMVARAADLFRRCGTVGGLAELVALQTGAEVEVVDNGGVAWSPVPGGPLPGSSHPSVTVRLRASDPGALNMARLDAVVTAARPAHVPHRIEVVGT